MAETAKDIAIRALKREYYLTHGGGKYVVLAMFSNIPIFGYVPFLTQALTIVFLSFFLKHCCVSEERMEDAAKGGTVLFVLHTVSLVLVLFVMLMQLVTVRQEYQGTGQMFTLAMLGIIYATMTRYKTT